jgi:hypothetical protein
MLDTRRDSHYSTNTAEWAAAQRRPAGKGINGPQIRSRYVYVLLLYVRLRAGVFDGLDLETKSRIPTTHPPQGRWVLSFGAKKRPRIRKTQ